MCRAVFGVIGACLVASGRGKANEVERQRFHQRMVSLGRTLMQVRDTFAHNPPPQMEGLLVTLKRQNFSEVNFLLNLLHNLTKALTIENFWQCLGVDRDV